MFCTTPLTLALLTLVSSAPFVLSRPAPLPNSRHGHGGGQDGGENVNTVDTGTILDNALEAQTLNTQFASMTIADSCTDGDVACIGGAIAFCANSAWETQNCPSNLTCLAAPSLSDSGVIVGCTTQSDVDTLINEAGAAAGIISNCDGAGNNQNVTSTDNATCTDTSSLGPIVTGGANDSGVLTVTVTLNPTAPTTLPAVTSTLASDQASSLLSSLNANPSISVSTISAAAAATTDPSIAGALAGAPAAAPTTILLTPQPSSGAPTATPAPAPANGQGAVGALAQGDAQAPAPTTILLTAQPPSSTASQASATPAAAVASAPPPAAAAPGGYGY